MYLFKLIARYLYLHVCSWRSKVFLQKRFSLNPHSDIVVSMTTIPSRSRRITPVILSLLNQSYPPQKIIVNVPKYFTRFGNQKLVLPECILPFIEINEVDKDYGPGTKLLPALDCFKDEPDQKIVVVDDDWLFPKLFLETLHRATCQHPDAAIALKGWRVPKSGRHKERKLVKGRKLNETAPVDILPGFSGFLVKPGFFTDKVFGIESAIPSMKYTDDIWFSGQMAIKGTPRLVVPAPKDCICLKALGAILTTSLVLTKNFSHSNNNNAYQYFKDKWL